jgi:hypothetical protein
MSDPASGPSPRERRAPYYTGCEETHPAPPFFRDPATERESVVARLPGAGGAFTVSPDGQTILYARFVGGGTDLMMIENFR